LPPIPDLAHIVVGKNGPAVIELVLVVPAICSKWQMRMGTRVAPLIMIAQWEEPE